MAQAFIASHILRLAGTALIVVWLSVSYEVYLVESALPNGNIKTFQDALWWGLVTFLTVGYGDLYPTTEASRLAASVLMFSGVLTMGIATAKISSALLQDVLLKGRRPVNSQSLRDHFLICGWKEDMPGLLDQILYHNQDLTVDDLVLMAMIDERRVDEIISTDRYKRLKIIIGESYHEEVLARGHPERAQRILILADRAPGSSGGMPTVHEADARTVMTAIALSKMARGIPVTAEILDEKVSQHLRIAGVTDIIYSREYSRLLLGNAAGGTGLTNVIFDLLTPETEAMLHSIPIPKTFLGKNYQDFKSHYELSHPRIQVIGILENTGNPYALRNEALREAQKTADVQRMIKNLKSARNLRYNQPVFNPGEDYKIKERSAAIIIQIRPDVACGAPIYDGVA